MAEVRDMLEALRSAPVMVATTTREPQPEVQVGEPDAVTERVESQPRQPRPARRRVALLLAGGLVILAGGVLAGQLTPDRKDATDAAPQPPTTSSMPSSNSAVSATPLISATPSGTVPPTASRPPTVHPPPNGGPSALSAVITEYYALMPGNLAEGCNRLTPRYQRNPAGGRGGYQAFWDRIRGVHTSGVTPVAANVVEATVEYNFKNGKLVRERHRYVLVDDGGRRKIDQSTVLSSQTFDHVNAG
ncbi:hypothetical protein AOZ06_42670 [Kibdelosporangium phytohabitans]|uniref:Uncharacterized protein n=2 Tax=Kibdelosporangium phytohabitans TaxID=860235 RepID=A0A0N9I9J7_9PSEU|nr:hypothetical protein AOZ06_42670 [Kibdelosporangium phytohabitans]